MATVQGKIENRGGKREGSGRKMKTISTYQLALLSKTLKEFQKKTGKSIYDILVGIIYAEDSRQGDRLAAVKLIMESTIAKSSEKDVNITQRMEPSIYLPEQYADPAQIVALQGGKK